MADEQGDADVVPSSPEIHFEPIVRLPLVEIKTLEEDEETLFEMRAKLYRYDNASDPPEWKERGTGNIKILKHSSAKYVRILMRRDKTLKICANHLVQPYMELKPNSSSDRAWIWSVLADFADEESKSELLAIKFGNAENAQKFKEAFENAKNLSAEMIKDHLNAEEESDDAENEEDKSSSTDTTPVKKETLKDTEEITNKLSSLTVVNSDEQKDSEKSEVSEKENSDIKTSKTADVSTP